MASRERVDVRPPGEDLVAIQSFCDRCQACRLLRWLVTLFVAATYVLWGCLDPDYSSYIGFFATAFLGSLGLFLTPIEDLDALDNSLQPTTNSDDLKLLQRCLPEYHFWLFVTMPMSALLPVIYFFRLSFPTDWRVEVCALAIAFPIFMYWPIKNLIKHKFVPFDFGKKVYAGNKLSFK